MGFLDFFRTTPKVIDTAANVVDAGIRGIDALFFTDEEKSESSRKTYELWLETQKIIRDENTIRSMTRRILACMIMGEFTLLLLMAAVAWPFMPEWGKMLLEIAKSLSNLVIAIAIFYFGPYAFSAYMKKKK